MMRNPAAGTRAEPSLVIPPIPGTFDESTVRGGGQVGYPGGESPSPPPPPGSGDAAVSISSLKISLEVHFASCFLCLSLLTHFDLWHS